MTFFTYCVAFLCSINSFVEIDGILYSHCGYILWFGVGKEKRVFKKKIVGKAIYKNTNNIRVLYWQKSRHWKSFFLSCAWIEIVIQTGKIIVFTLFFLHYFFGVFFVVFQDTFLSRIICHYYCPYKSLSLL